MQAALLQYSTKAGSLIASGLAVGLMFNIFA